MAQNVQLVLHLRLGGGGNRFWLRWLRDMLRQGGVRLKMDRLFRFYLSWRRSLLCWGYREGRCVVVQQIRHGRAGHGVCRFIGVGFRSAHNVCVILRLVSKRRWAW